MTSVKDEITQEINNSINNQETPNTLDEIIQGKSNSKNNLSDKNKQEKTDYCKELKNIAYKTMLLNGHEIVPDVNNTNNNTLSKYLQDETCANQKENWSKLDKTQKVKKLIHHVELLEKKFTLNEEEANKCKKYLLKCLERKALTKVKDVHYDKDKGVISDIPNLHFDIINRVFALKKDEKHISTVKCLPQENKSKAKTIKILEQ
jgi:uncharacterized iron-regulated protein